MIKEECDYCKIYYSPIFKKAGIPIAKCSFCNKNICKQHNLYLFDIEKIHTCIRCRNIINKIANDNKASLCSDIINIVRKAVTIEYID